MGGGFVSPIQQGKKALLHAEGTLAEKNPFRGAKRGNATERTFLPNTGTRVFTSYKGKDKEKSCTVRNESPREVCDVRGGVEKKEIPEAEKATPFQGRRLQEGEWADPGSRGREK